MIISYYVRTIQISSIHALLLFTAFASGRTIFICTLLSKVIVFWFEDAGVLLET